MEYFGSLYMILLLDRSWAPRIVEVISKEMDGTIYNLQSYIQLSSKQALLLNLTLGLFGIEQGIKELNIQVVSAWSYIAHAKLWWQNL